MPDLCTLAEVKGWLPLGQDLDSQTGKKPDGATVLLWIPKYTATVNAALSRQGETTPLTGDRATEVGMIVAREIAYQIVVLRGEKGKVSTGDWEGIKWHDEYLLLIGATKEQATATTDDQTVMPFGYPDATVAPVFTRSQAREW